MSENVLDKPILPLHPLQQVLVLLPSVGHNRTRVPAYLLERLHFPMLIVGAPYDVVHDQTIKDAFVGDSNKM